jgi:hypothetical protein
MFGRLAAHIAASMASRLGARASNAAAISDLVEP